MAREENNPTLFSVRKRIKSFSYAFAGIRLLITSQHNAWIQLAIGTLVVLAGLFFRIGRLEWCCVLACIGAVLSLEAVNTSIEHLADTLHPDRSEGIRKVKDLAAGAVLIASIVAVVVGLLIFVPYITGMFR